MPQFKLLAKILQQLRQGKPIKTKEGYQALEHLQAVMRGFEELGIPEYVEFAKTMKIDYDNLCNTLWDVRKKELGIDQ